MRYVILACMIGIALGAVVDFDLLIGLADDPAEFSGPHDTRMPASVAERAFLTLHTEAHKFVRFLLDAFSASHQERTQLTLWTELTPQ
jgi:hypothetical protein